MVLFLQHPIHVSTGHLVSSVCLNAVCQSHRALASTRHIHDVQFLLLTTDIPCSIDQVASDVEMQLAATIYTNNAHVTEKSAKSCNTGKITPMKSIIYSKDDYINSHLNICKAASTLTYNRFQVLYADSDDAIYNGNDICIDRCGTHIITVRTSPQLA